MAATLNNTVQQWRARGEFHQLCGHSIFVLDEGAPERPSLLLIHGFPTSSWDWHAILDNLAKDYRLIALDMLGFGLSDKPNNRFYTIQGQADIIEALIETKQLTSFHVLAHDYGDTVAQELLARQVEGTGAGNWLSGCFLNGGLFPETHHALFTQKLLLSPIGSLVNRLSNYTKFVQSFTSVFGANSQPTAHALETFWALININQGRHVFHNLITYIHDRIEHRERWVAALQMSTVPLALINGSVDPVSGAHMVVRYQELACRLDYLVQLPNIGHYPQVEAPEDLASHYREYLKRVG